MEKTPDSNRKLWLMVELIVLAGIIGGLFLIVFSSATWVFSQSLAYVFIGTGFFCIVGIEIYLAVRSSQP